METQPPERRTSGSQSKLKPETLPEANDKTEAVLLQAHHEKSGYFGRKKNVMLGKEKAARKKEGQT